MEKYFLLKTIDYDENIKKEKKQKFLELAKELYTLKRKKLFTWRSEVFRLHIYKDNKVKFLFGFNYQQDNKRIQIIQKMLKNYYGEEAVEEIEKPLFSKTGRTLKAIQPMYLLNFTDFFEKIVSVIPENIIITIDFKANEKIKKYIQQEIEGIQHKKTYIKDNFFLEKKEKEIKKIKENKYFFNLDVYINTINNKNKNNLYLMCKKISVFTDSEINNLKPTIGFFGVNPKEEINFKYKSKAIITEKDISDILLLPSYMKFPKLLINAKPQIDEKMFSKGILVGKHIKDDKSIIDFRISLEQFSKHMFLCAGTGGGKSSLLFTFLDDLLFTHNQKYGATIIDPNEETLVKFVNHALAMEKKGIEIDWNKIHYIDLVNGKYLPSLNLLNIPYGESDIDIIQSYIMETLKAVYPTGATPKIDEYFRNVIGTLLLENRKNTILDANKLLTDEKRQKQVQRNIGDGYYEQTYKNLWKTPPKPSEVDSTLRRLNLFQSPQMQRMYGLPEFDLPIRKWLDNGHLILINTKGLSEEKLKLNAGHILSQYVQVAKTRGTSGTRPHFLIIDEGKQFQLPIIWKNIIPEARKFGLFLVETTQTITSLVEDFKNEIIENVDTIISGRLGDSGAKIVSRMMNDSTNPKFLKNLEDFHLLAYTRGTNKKIVTADIVVNPPYWYFLDKNKLKIAEYKNFKEENIAEKWAREKIEFLQKRDWRHISVLDELLKKRYSLKSITKMKELENNNTNEEVNINNFFE